MNEDRLPSSKPVLIDVKVFSLLILCWTTRNDVLHYKYMYINTNVNSSFCVEESPRYHSTAMELHLVPAFRCPYI